MQVCPESDAYRFGCLFFRFCSSEAVLFSVIIGIGKFEVLLWVTEVSG